VVFLLDHMTGKYGKHIDAAHNMNEKTRQRCDCLFLVNNHRQLPSQSIPRNGEWLRARRMRHKVVG
jgi:hypothetical protein